VNARKRVLTVAGAGLVASLVLAARLTLLHHARSVPAGITPPQGTKGAPDMVTANLAGDSRDRERAPHPPVSHASAANPAGTDLRLTRDLVSALEELLRTEEDHLRRVYASSNFEVEGLIKFMDLHSALDHRIGARLPFVETRDSVGPELASWIKLQASGTKSDYGRLGQMGKECLARVQVNSEKLLVAKKKLCRSDNLAGGDVGDGKVTCELETTITHYQHLLDLVGAQLEQIHSDFRSAVRLAEGVDLALLAGKPLQTLQACDSASTGLANVQEPPAKLALTLLVDYRFLLGKVLEWREKLAEAREQLEVR
jgi:hypothetical protein